MSPRTVPGAKRAVSSTRLNGREEADAARALLGAVLVDRSHLGTRIWDVIANPDADFAFHVPFQLPYRIPLAPVGPTVELFLSAITVDCEATGDTGGLRSAFAGVSAYDGDTGGLRSAFAGVSAYDGDTEIASFATGGWRGGVRTFQLAGLKPFRSGLELVFRLEVPVGASGSFEFRSASVTLARPRVLSSPGDVVTRLRTAIGR